MEIVLGIGRLLAFGAVAVALIAWLCSRAFAWSRRAGVVFAAIVAGYCGGVAAILVIGSIDAGDSLRLGGVLSVAAFMSIACGAILSAKRRSTQI